MRETSMSLAPLKHLHLPIPVPVDWVFDEVVNAEHGNRFLKPEGVLLPSSARLQCAPVSLDAMWREKVPD